MNKNELWNLVQSNDRKIYDLATYYVTKGFVIKADPEKVMERFAEFKNRILIGSITLERLEVDVLKKFGVTEGVEYISAPVEAFPKDLQDMIEELSVPVEDKPEE